MRLLLTPTLLISLSLLGAAALFGAVPGSVQAQATGDTKKKAPAKAPVPSEEDDEGAEGDEEPEEAGDSSEPASDGDEGAGDEVSDEDAEDDDEVSTDAAPAGPPEGGLRAPDLAMPDVALEAVDDEEEVGPTVEESPALGLSRLEEGAPPSSDPTRDAWSAPLPVITLHGYLRTRLELQDTFYLGREAANGVIDYPFSRFRPGENGVVPAGGCGDTGSLTSGTPCGSEALGFANMRLRLAPTLALSDDVRVHALFDVFDNFVLGSTPDGLSTLPSGEVLRSSRDSEDRLTYSQAPPEVGRNSLQDSVRAKRAWGEVTNRGLGQLRFGRMGWHWGLGIFANGGEGIDADFQTDVDRIMAIAKLFDLYFMAAYDFSDEGFIQANRLDPAALPYDAIQDDDVDQVMFGVARRMSEEEQQDALQRGDVVLNGGAFLLYRDQLLSSRGSGAGTDLYGNGPSRNDPTFLVRREAEAFVPDLWVQFLWEGLRLETEALFVLGSLQNKDDNAFTEDNFDILQFGLAFEGEYRLLEDKLGIYFNFGLASGDDDVEGLSPTQPDGSPAGQRAAGTQPADRTISTYRFHPNYRVDLILWRNILTQVSGAYYFKPGISYDFIRNAFGQQLGIRADFIYSRATSSLQTWGNDGNLGLEIDAALYYQSEDGPDLLDGFYAMLQYGVLFPMQGLGYLSENGVTQVPGGNPSLENAQTVRLILGIHY
ncbi:MAG: TIGR04551 family protein [Myxococcales bacterium]|nr:TIGR04551 family protein [Myxococcales bacterium]